MLMGNRVFENSVNTFFFAFLVYITGPHKNPGPGVNQPDPPLVGPDFHSIQILLFKLIYSNTLQDYL